MTPSPPTPESGRPHEGAWRCPNCGQAAPEGAPSLPFCSVRCQLVDLGRWFDEAFFVPGEAAIDMDGLAPLREPQDESDARP